MSIPATYKPVFRNALVAAALAVSSLASAQAGGFGGPAPFRNGSPLVSGTDGTYQAVASAKNVTGLIQFAIKGGVQTAVPMENRWVMFVDGEILSGQTEANISDGKVAGVLNANIAGLPTNEDGTISLPVAFVVPGNAGAGRFWGKIDLNNPVAAFDGKGELSGTPARTDQIVFISEVVVGTGGVGGGVSITPITIPASALGNVPFKIRGTRLSTTTSLQTVSSSAP